MKLQWIDITDYSEIPLKLTFKSNISDLEIILTTNISNKTFKTDYKWFINCKGLDIKDKTIIGAFSDIEDDILDILIDKLEQNSNQDIINQVKEIKKRYEYLYANIDSYLSDSQYLILLDKIYEKLKSTDKFELVDSNIIGNKYVASNIGFCNEDYTTIENALFIVDYIEYKRKSLKYRDKLHACPFDNRVRNNMEKSSCSDFGSGCFYTCCLKKNISKEDLKKYVLDTKEKFLNGDLEKIRENHLKKLGEIIYGKS